MACETKEGLAGAWLDSVLVASVSGVPQSSGKELVIDALMPAYSGNPSHLCQFTVPGYLCVAVVIL